MLRRRSLSIVATVIALSSLGPSWKAGALRSEQFEIAWHMFVQSSADYRNAQPRLSALPHQPWRPSRGGSASLPLEQRVAALHLERAVRIDSPPSAHAKLGVARLVTGDVAGGVDELERARAGSATPSILSDLAAAYLMRADGSHSAGDLARALDSAQRAMFQDSSYAPAWFNRALALERLNLHSLAAESWARAASLGATDWRAEALENTRNIRDVEFREEKLKKLARSIDSAATNERALASDDADLIAEVTERVVLRNWATAIQSANRVQAAATVLRARHLASYVRAATGDPYLVDLVQQLTQFTSSASAQNYAKGWLAYVHAVELWDDDHIDASRRMLGVAERHLQGTASALWIELYRAGLERFEGRTEEALSRLAKLEQRAARLHYPTILGRALWQHAVLCTETGAFGDAFTRYEKALAILEKVRDREAVAVLHMLIASHYFFLGATETGWVHEAIALDGLSLARRIRRDPILSIAALLSSADGLHAGAVTFREQAIREARAAQSSVSLVFLLNDHTSDLRAAGMSVAAAAAIAEAKRHVRNLDPGTADMAQALINITESGLIAEKSPDHAVDLLAESARLYERRRTPYARATTQLRRGQLLAQLNRPAEAASAFRDGIDVTERERTSVRALADAAALQGTRWDLYTELADLYLRQNHVEAAFDVLQRGRVAAVNPDITKGTTRAPLFAADNLTVVFGIVRSKVLVWARSSTRRAQFVATTAAEDLGKLVQRHRVLLQTGSDAQEFERLSRQLFDVLFAPVRSDLRNVASVTIVPDGVLCELAFGALIDTQTERFLIEQIAINIAPALPSDRSVQTGTADARKGSRILVVGNPDRSAAREDRTSSLPYADEEARAVAALYDNSILQSRSGATRRSVLKALLNTTAVHFAGHAIAESARPELSRLLLTPDDSDTLGALFAADIDHVRLQTVDLVVLAACGTAAGRVTRGTGVMSLARAFLYAGAHSVVATLWPIDDKESSSLFVDFHRQWIRGLAPAEALRAAQLEALHAGSAPRHWAAVVTFVR